MCFSVEADFVAAAVLAPIGVLTIRAARRPRELPLAIIPLFFAFHQFVEGFVWLGIDGDASQGVESFAIYLYLAMAQMILPILVPLAIAIIEPRRKRRIYMYISAGGGAVLAIGFGSILAQGGAHAYPMDHTLIYKTLTDMPEIAGLVYLNACVFTTLASSSRYLVLFGIANAIGISVAGWFRYEAVTSVWCIYAAAISFLLLLHLRNPKTFVPLPGDADYDGGSCPNTDAPTAPPAAEKQLA